MGLADSCALTFCFCAGLMFGAIVLASLWELGKNLVATIRGYWKRS